MTNNYLIKMTVDTHKTIDIRREDFEYMDTLRKTPFGKISYAEVFHMIIDGYREFKGMK